MTGKQLKEWAVTVLDDASIQIRDQHSYECAWQDKFLMLAVKVFSTKGSPDATRYQSHAKTSR